MVSNAAAVARPVALAAAPSSDLDERTVAAIDERADIVRTIRDRALRAKRVGSTVTASAFLALASDLETEALNLFGAFRCACGDGSCMVCDDEGFVRAGAGQ